MSEPKNVLVDIWLLASVADALVSAGLTDSPLSVDEFALFGLVHDLNQVTVTRLAGWTGLPVTTVSAIVRRCESRGDLSRRQDPSDRRSSLIELTPAGKKVYLESLPALEGALDRLTARLQTPLEDARSRLQDLDSALRAALDLPARPYVTTDTEVAALAHLRSLTPEQTAELNEFARWLQYRDRAHR
ncbi:MULTISPECIES: MarR family winged helix-turn-helix transcriptional regulator [Tsukamurella]|uniref:HTH marR-type domain-containing protein n=2 Tax=Tsukamurella pseudospumae TaxID=239498 RepID=A0A138AFN6_9ACTN|nr:MULTISPECIES: MarR family winged helix-turn-helix transcriptional regulator [Tsukamurella]KXP09296.1 hypothetical protein AXK60_25010 [Tsukamurella pseudospumae]